MQFGFGSGVMYAIRTDLANQTPIRFGAMQDISVEFNGEIKELYAQSQFAIDAARGKVKIMGKAKLAQISAAAFNTIFFGGALSTGQTLSVYNETATTPAAIGATAATSATSAIGSPTLTFTSVPAGVAVGQLVTDATAATAVANGSLVTAKSGTTVTLSKALVGAVAIADTINFLAPVAAANSTTYSADLGVYYASSGNILTYTAAYPTVAGTYTEYGGSYFFSTADVSQGVLLNYLYTATGGFTLAVGNPLMGTTPKFQGVFTESYGGNSIVMTLYACVASKLTMPTKIDDYIIPELDFSAYQNAAGQTVNMYMNT